MIMGSLYVVFIFLGIKLILRGLLSIKCIKNIGCVIKIKDFLTNGLIFNEIIEFMFAAYSEILFATVLHINKFNWTYKSNYSANISFCLFSALIFIFPIWLLILLWRNYDKLNKNEYLTTYSSAYKDLKLN
jgi:hypothetical protein